MSPPHAAHVEGSAPGARVLCVEDDGPIAELLQEVLAEAGYRVALAADGGAAMERWADGHDAVVCDLDLPGACGLDVLRAVRAAGSRVPFVVLTAFAGRENQIEARRLGCDDFLPKPVDFDLLLAVLHNVLLRSASTGRGAGWGGADRTGPGPVGGGPQLSEREREVMGWVARGKSSAEIAVIAGISERTVNFHVDRVLRKLDVATRTQAAVACARLGLIEV